MEALSFEQLASESEARAFDRAVLASPGIDHFCSSSDWTLPAALALRPGRAPFVRRGQGGGYLALAVARDQERTWLEPLEAMWGTALLRLKTVAEREERRGRRRGPVR